MDFHGLLSCKQRWEGEIWGSEHEDGLSKCIWQ